MLLDNVPEWQLDFSDTQTFAEAIRAVDDWYHQLQDPLDTLKRIVSS